MAYHHFCPEKKKLPFGDILGGHTPWQKPQAPQRLHQGAVLFAKDLAVLTKSPNLTLLGGWMPAIAWRFDFSIVFLES